MATLFDSHLTAPNGSLSLSPGQQGGTNFTGNGSHLDSVKFKVNNGGTSPTGTMRANVYLATGTPGTTAKPTGAVLATSDSINVNTLGSTGNVEVTFTFSGANRITTTNGTIYIASLEFVSGGTGGINQQYNSTSSASYNMSIYSSGSWSTPFTGVFDFEIYSDVLTITSPPIVLDGSGSLSVAYNLIHLSASLLFDGAASLAIDFYHDLASLPPQKVYEYKIFDNTGVYLTSLADVLNDYDYQQDINTPGNAITVELGQTADVLAESLAHLITSDTSENIDTEDSNDLLVVTASGAQVGTGSNLNLNYRIEVWCYYGYDDFLVDENSVPVVDENGTTLGVAVGAPAGLKLFSGFISDYAARYGQNETTLLYCLPYSRDLDHYVIKNGPATTVAYNSYDPSNILTAILDNFVSQGGSFSYDTSSVSISASVVSYTFKLNTILEGVKKCLELAPSNWWWYGDVAYNKVYFKPLPTSVSHTFTLGKEIRDLVLHRSIEKVINDYYFLGGDTANDLTNPVYLYKHYSDATSIANYRPGLARDTDQRVTDATSVDILAGAKLAANKDPRYQAELTVLDVAYDIQSIQLGQLIGFQNFNNFIDSVQLQIVSLHYTPDFVTIKLDSLIPQPSKRLEDIKRNLQQTVTASIPTTPS